ncbi:MAG: hypothetical protein QOF16_1563 [Actinomycetota bacterium]|jgi:DNA-binding HxlR family transcriptional regulator|nr:hypothetical protein [Actinomycetota bacterium]MEA2487909.1 hypothetical protein [Actinomycetota bacterium]
MAETRDHAAQAAPITPFCPNFHRAIEIVGRRWTGAIIRTLLADKHHFSDICKTVPGLSDRLLSERLKELELEGIVTRTVIPETPVRVEYSLTEKGASLADAVRSMSEWAEHWAVADTSHLA